ncbi:DTW domain-containing protein [Pseudoalteromonas phenolica]|uniref:tRNA-uridine aminocarboxypropyltransferase n=1 Tax=Pseudoalteromonas phenolica TaxID=161398 RepID=A0A5R9Q143_9GAMM|nr:tRNA-uridine aminocarboxypropyltransferase [Pseudoalteromonas phenolica]TLX46107.1 DTW domain-containing protein [Pseudoalteromonas phenolica]
MKRSNCTKCHYPVTTCVCEYVTKKVKNRTKIVILQHPDEVNLAKNTVRLLQLQLSDIQVVIGETERDFSSVLNDLPKESTALLYPGKESIDVHDCSALAPKLTHLMVIDGTWKKTNKIFALNPWLQSLQKISFSSIPENQYRIRKAEQAYSLSTLEAVGHFIHVVDGCDNQPLLHLLNGMIEQQTKFMPEHVKARYFED